MNTPSPANKKAPTPDSDASALAGPDSAGNVDKIRDILFGNQIRTYEKRFGKLEDKLAKETQDLREEIKQRFAALEAYLKSELGALADLLKTEKGERTEADKALGRDLKEAARNQERKTTLAEEQTAKAFREMRQHLLDEAKRLTEEIERRHSEVHHSLDTESQDLRTSLTDRMALAELFSEVALRLKNEFKMPAKK